MKYLLGLSVLTLALTACGQPNTTPPATLTVNAGKALKTTLIAPISGDWHIENLPTWLSVTREHGSGPLMLTLNVHRPALAASRHVTSQFRIRWTQNGTTGTTTVAVNADMYRVSGRVAPLTTASTAGDAKTTTHAARGPTSTSQSVIVKYKTDRALVRAQSLGAPLQQTQGRTALLRTTNVNATLRQLRHNPDVEYAVPNATLHTLARPAVVPEDQYANLQWAFALTGYGAVWRDMHDTPYQKDVTVAVLDTGVRFDHPDLHDSLWGPGEGALDLVPNDATGRSGDPYGSDDDPTDPGDPNSLTLGSHGTHVTGIIAARWGKFTAPCAECSDSGVVGATYTAPVKVLPVRVLSASGGDVFTIASGIRYAAGLKSITMNGRTYQNPNPASIINLSLGGAISADEAQPLCEAISEATAHGALVIAAAGNAGDTSLYYPAACEDAVSVASVGLEDGLPKRAYYSNANARVTLAAPGGNDQQAYNGAVLRDAAFPDMIFSTSWNYQANRPNYEAMVGTSQAAPQVSALAALLLSKGTVSSARDALQRIISTATDLGPAGRDDDTGHGLINAAAALGAASVELPVSVLAQRLTSSTPRSVRLNLDPLGRFEGFLPDGEYRLLVRRDTNGNGIYGEASEPRAETTFKIGPDATDRNVGTLSPQ